MTEVENIERCTIAELGAAAATCYREIAAATVQNEGPAVADHLIILDKAAEAFAKGDAPRFDAQEWSYIKDRFDCVIMMAAVQVLQDAARAGEDWLDFVCTWGTAEQVCNMTAILTRITYQRGGQNPQGVRSTVIDLMAA